MKNKLTAAHRIFLVCLLSVFAAGAAAAKDELPDKTTDGLDRVKSKKVDALYWKQGATLDAYKRIHIDDCFVAFKKNWERDYNRDQVDLSMRVSDDDMARIKKELAAEFIKEFTEELQKRGGYEITDEIGADVLLLRPAIVNLDVNAPDVRGPSMVTTFVSSAGQMTLYMEIYDSATSDKIGLVMDARADSSPGRGQRANEVTNRAAADRMLRHWAHLLREALDEAHKKDEDDKS